MAHSGHCLCGEIQYEFEVDPPMAAVCHCKNCQRQTGSAYSSLYGVPPDALQLKGTLKLYRDADTDSGNTVERWFCGSCGSPIYSLVSGMPGMAFLKTGTLDSTEGFQPQVQLFCDSKQDWVPLVEGVPAMPKGT